MWEGIVRSMAIHDQLAPAADKNDAFWSSAIEPFKAKRTANDSLLTKQFQQASSLLYQFKHNLQPAVRIMDVERMAAYVAISDMSMAHHALTWHNQRFYYNPVANLF